jgi:carbamoyl-phosphate synthase large subunit
VAAIPVATAEQARAWITLWRDLQGIRVSNFTLGEYLPGRHFIVQGLWRAGDLLRTETMEVLSYFAAGNNPSAVFSLSNLAKTIVAPQALEIALDAVNAIEQKPSGTFIVELKERIDGTPCITEINAGRFPAGVTALLAGGGDNMVEMFARAALGEVERPADPNRPKAERYLVRDIDALPMALSPADLVADAPRAGSGRSTKRGRRLK